MLGQGKKMRWPLLCVALTLVPGAGVSQELREIAQWCYAASELLSQDAGMFSEYALMRDHLSKVLRKSYRINPTEAKIVGMSQITGAARLKNTTPEMMALTFYKQICKPVFIQ
jgi:hypothetical protein